jgi:hypothetical protein
VFALIEEHRIAYIAHGAVCAAAESTEAQLQAASIADRDAQDALTNTVPTTIAGCAALLRYAHEFYELEGCDPEIWDIYRIVKNVAGALERLASNMTHALFVAALVLAWSLPEAPWNLERDAVHLHLLAALKNMAAACARRRFVNQCSARVLAGTHAAKRLAPGLSLEAGRLTFHLNSGRLLIVANA